MKIFVAGATGVLGKRAVREIVASGHEVTGVARSPEKAELLRALGATPVTVDIFDATAVKDAAGGHDVVANLATHIPASSRAALPGGFADNDRIRTEASKNLVDAALSAGATRYIQESITFSYVDSGDQWIDEGWPLKVPAYAKSALVAEAEAHRFTEAGGVGMVLRFAAFYGPDSHTTVDLVKAARRRISPFFGAAGYLSSINTDDAGSAVAAALHAPAGVYNITDDEPLTRRAYLDALTDVLGTKPVRIPPKALAKAMGSKGAIFGRSQRISNRRFRDATGWSPKYPSVREGWTAVLEEMPDP